MNIELTILQLGEELALALATGLFLGIAVGIKLYERYVADSKRTATSKLGSCLEAR